MTIFSRDIQLVVPSTQAYLAANPGLSTASDGTKSFDTWHARRGHIHNNIILDMAKNNSVHGCGLQTKLPIHFVPVVLSERVRDALFHSMNLVNEDISLSY